MKDPWKCPNDCSDDSLSHIESILPHRQPFLFLSRIISIQSGQSAVAEFDIPQEHVFFQGHFPQEPIFPGVIILEIMAQTGALAILDNPANRGQIAYLAGIESARFKRPVNPGETLRAEVSIESMRMNIGRVQAKASVNGVEVARAQIRFALSV